MKCVYTRDIIFFIVSESALRINHSYTQAHSKKTYQKWHNFSLFDFLDKMPATLHNQPKYESALRYFMSDRVRISISYNASTRQIRQGQAVLLPSIFATRCKQKACQEHALKAQFWRIEGFPDSGGGEIRLVGRWGPLFFRKTTNLRFVLNSAFGGMLFEKSFSPRHPRKCCSWARGQKNEFN